MRTLTQYLMVVALLSVSAVVEAGPILVGDKIEFDNAPGTTGGGEFLVTVNDVESFITFCLQRTVYIDSSTDFVVTGVTSYASSDPAAQGGDGFGRDPLSPHTAWLYTQFRNGSLAG